MRGPISALRRTFGLGDAGVAIEHGESAAAGSANRIATKAVTPVATHLEELTIRPKFTAVF